jgi:hypothetical protein
MQLPNGYLTTSQVSEGNEDLPDYLQYSPEKFEDNYGHKPVHYWQSFSLQRLDYPENFLSAD